MSKAVGVIVGNTVEWHAPGAINDYATLCGIDAHDASLGHQGTVDPSPHQKIECEMCRLIWASCKHLRATDFK